MASASRPDRPRRRPTRESTRERVLAAAVELFAAQGPAATSVEQVARHAGLTKGAVYSSFATKDELFAAAVDRLPVRTLAAASPAGARDRAEFAEQLRTLGDVVANSQPPDATVAYLHELYAYALRHPGSRDVLAAWVRRIFDESAEQTAETILAGGIELDVTVTELWVLGQALIEGLFVRRALNPELVDDALIVKAMALLAGLVREPDRPSVSGRRARGTVRG